MYQRQRAHSMASNLTVQEQTYGDFKCFTLMPPKCSIVHISFFHVNFTWQLRVQQIILIVKVINPSIPSLVFYYL